MEYKIGDNLKSQINARPGYYKLVKITITHYFLEAYENNGEKTFPNNNNGKLGIYKKTKKWVEKNMYYLRSN